MCIEIFIFYIIQTYTNIIHKYDLCLLLHKRRHSEVYHRTCLVVLTILTAITKYICIICFSILTQLHIATTEDLGGMVVPSNAIAVSDTYQLVIISEVAL